MASLTKTIQTVMEVKEILSTKVCDKLKGDCNKCPFKEKCVVEQLLFVELQLRNTKDKIEEMI